MAAKNIFKRDDLVRNVKGKKPYDYPRKKSIVLNNRVTPEEKDIILKRIELTGLLKQDYITQSCMYGKITVIGNVKSFDAIRKEMKVIDKHLCDIQRADELDFRVLESLRMILEILDGFYGKENEK